MQIEQVNIQKKKEKKNEIQKIVRNEKIIIKSKIKMIKRIKKTKRNSNA